MITDPLEAAKLIRNGNIVAIPTETVYGLAADVFNIHAVAKTFKTKGRPVDNPLIVHISKMEQLESLTVNPSRILFQLADCFWPGPLTIVVSKHADVPDIVTGGLSTVAVRMPDHPLTLEMIDHSGPVTAPSANKSGSPSPTRPDHVILDYQHSVPILDGGICRIGIESTVVDLSGIKPVILRPGSITAGMIKDKTGVIVSEKKQPGEDHFKSPGTRYTHYKPSAKVAWLESGSLRPDPGSYYLFHSKRAEENKSSNTFYYNGDYVSFAKDLYDHFRTADHLSFKQIYVEPLPDTDQNPLIPALRDRISKAIGS